MKIIKFSDFMAKKHQIVGLSHQEEQFAESLKYLFYIMVAVLVATVIPTIPFIPMGVQDAFLYM